MLLSKQQSKDSPNAKVRRSTASSALDGLALNAADSLVGQNRQGSFRNGFQSPEFKFTGEPVLNANGETKKSIDTLGISQTGKLQGMHQTARLNQT